MKKLKPILRQFLLTAVLWAGGSLAANAENVKGVVTDEAGDPLIGVTVMVKGVPGGTATDLDGNFTINVPDMKNGVLQFRYVGMKLQEVKVEGRTNINVTMSTDSDVLDEIVVVGYGQQKKASVVGAIAQTSGETLARAGGVSSVGAALTGNLPGVVTMQSSGMPGDEDPKIVIRGQTSWNSSDPLILVDGIERPMSSVDIGSVESVSVLKDASATAVYGVKGANGVILITTKRGQEGRAKIGVNMNAAMKVISHLPGTEGSPEALYMRNKVIERELGLTPDSWSSITPMAIIEKYRNPANLEEAERYPNVDWKDALFNKTAMAYNPSINVHGGTKFVKYFAALDFLHEGDLFKEYPTGRGYKGGYGFNRVNIRSNLDFQITKTTTFTMNLSGSHGEKKSPYNVADDSFGATQLFQAAYSAPSDAFIPRYSDGTWGYYPANTQGAPNSMQGLATGGVEYTTTTRINTDFTLAQDLSFITKGLRASATISWDNVFVEGDRGINENWYSPLYKWIDPETGNVIYSKEVLDNGLDYSEDMKWSTREGDVRDWLTQRNLYYQVQLYWQRLFGDHDVSAMGVFNRNERGTGSEFLHYREDWAFRATYNYADKYFIEYNGAYNGSEKFDRRHRFDFFNSGAVGWRISQEKFMNWSRYWLDNLKVRYSIGQVGDDNVWQRWMYATQWAIEESKNLSTVEGQTSPYQWYKESVIGNPDIHWEKALKQNLGIDFTILNGMINGTVELFKEDRKDILVAGANRAIPSYFGGSAPTANLGRVSSKGYELELRFNYTFYNGFHLYANLNMTHAQNKVKSYDDPELMEAYRKTEGFAIGQDHIIYDAGYAQTWDDVIAMTNHNTNDNQKLPGQPIMVDYNGDGVIDSSDSTPFGYSSIPQNTYNATIGFNWKGWSFYAQFYGVTNVQRTVVFESYRGKLNTLFAGVNFWSPFATDVDRPLPVWNSTPAYYNGWDNRYNHYDGSYMRLKNLEVAYTWTNGWIKKLGLSSLKLYVNGNNLLQWSKMPDDRESNFAGTGNASQGVYPTVRRINFGFNLEI
ncbi:MAG: TonB-dependent receptor [Muribaculaceae bacterium]|nr:TonB-dependent receptor [Muribaculaceae bacterium]